MTFGALCKLGTSMLNTKSAYALKTSRMLATERTRHGLHAGRQQCQYYVQRPARLLRPRIAAGMLPDDFDAMLINRRSLSSVQKPPRSPSLPSVSNTSSSSSAASSMDASDSGSSSESSSGLSGMTLEDLKAHKRAAVQQAYLNGTLGFGFSAGGLVFPYYVGLVSSLVQRGVMTRPSQLAGSSAGSLIAASFNAGLDMETVEKSLIEFGENCLKNGTRYRLGPLLRDFLQQYLPPDAHELCSGNTHVAVTRLLPYWQTQMVSQFQSRDDLISALLTSCHIPWYFDGRWMTKFRGHYCVDGGVMAFIPSVPKAEYTVKVMCFPSSHLTKLKDTTRSSRRLKRLHDLLDIDITLDTYEAWPYDLQQILKWALVASAQETSSLLIEKGKRDAALWFDDMELQPLVQQQQQQQSSAQQGVHVSWSSSAGAGMGQVSGADDAEQAAAAAAAAVPAAAAAGPEEATPDDDAAADWSDRKSNKRRQEEADTVRDEAAGLGSTPAVTHAASIEQVAEAAGVDERVAAHAADAAKIAEPPLKKQHRIQHSAGAAAATAVAAGKEAAGKLQRAVVGDGDSEASSADGDRNKV
ncbi:acyl transferase/acyl hydrolase/lysophospholipase [Scenedesmus sp. NREL 46B-D3]|nr:acyl transferase/acyl hydrolase/lysophospholipase [Scenedesmus sp. NREL 46B-D3]